MIIGIDPGLKGAIAFYDPSINYLVTQEMPVRWKLVNKKKRHEIDTAALFATLRVWGHTTFETIIIEEPHAMPGAGATSQFTFGVSCGRLFALVECFKQIGHVERILYVDPSAWKKAMQCPSDKNRARARAVELFPDYKKEFERSTDDGKAEAALLAFYAAHAGDIKQKVRTAVKGRR